MNINDPEVDLTLALGSGNCTGVNSNSGAGVNANSKGFLPFAASDPLSELVWSPLNGLSLKCANSNMLEKKTFLTWNVGEAEKDISSIRSKGTRGIKFSNDKKMCVFRSSGGSSSSNVDAHHINCEVKVSETLARSLPRGKPDDEVTSAALGDMNKNKSTAPLSIPAPTLMMLESSAENDLAGKDGAPADSRICLYQQKGKEKASSDGDMWARSSNDDDDSHGSVESCNSRGLFPRGVKRPSFGQPQIIRTKRARKENQGGGSFRNWISNMVNGLSDHSKRDPSPLNVVLNETTDCTRRPNMGFQTVFQSLYKQSTKDDENSCKQIVLACAPNSSESPGCKRSLCEKVNSSSEKTGLNFPLPMRCMPGKSSPFSSLWITRLYTKTDGIEDCANDVLSSDNCAVDAVRASEEMASVFAKRLDALRSILKPSETRRSPLCQLVCLFCGRNGHDLRKCPKLTAAELKDLLVKITSFDKVEESPRLCIQCFQLDHWAISCPCNERCSSKRHLLQQSNSSSSEHGLKGKHVFPPREIVVPEEEMFNAISKLHLSRANILRWMNSDVPLSHLNGFFLRLRVGKIEGSLERRTTYYVACITGDAMESMNSKLKKSILVDVGGMKSCVGSQYISNHDFLEEEIKAWWSRIVKNGCKIPSIDELNSKCQHKKRLSLF